MDITPAQARTALVGLRLGLGAAAWLAPGTVAKLFGISPDDPSLPFLLRLFGARDVALAGLLQAADGDEADRVIEAGMAVDAADVLAAAMAGASGKVPKRAAIMAALTAGGAVYLGIVARDA